MPTTNESTLCDSTLRTRENERRKKDEHQEDAIQRAHQALLTGEAIRTGDVRQQGRNRPRTGTVEEEVARVRENEYVCRVCKSVFNGEDGLYKNPFTTEFFVACPVCGSESVEQAEYCAECGEAFLPSQIRGGWYCDDCLDSMTTPYHMHQYIIENLDDFAEWMHDRRVRNVQEK